MVEIIKRKSKADIIQTEIETPRTILSKLGFADNETYCYVDIYGGAHDSINRLIDKNCVVAYFHFDRLCYMIIKNTTEQIRLYRLFNFDNYTYRHCKITGEQVKKQYGDFLEIEGIKILNEYLFKQFKQGLMFEVLENDK